jgi:hypothetical protein
MIWQLFDNGHMTWWYWGSTIITKMATSGCDLTSDEIIHIKCCVCAGENRIREGEKYCKDCKEYFCSSCVGIHNNISSMKRHQIMDKGDFKSLGPDGSLPSYPTQRCAQHQLEVVTMYCKDHDEVACATCIALSISHRQVLQICIDQLYV